MKTAKFDEKKEKSTIMFEVTKILSKILYPQFFKLSKDEVDRLLLDLLNALVEMDRTKRYK